MGNLSIYVIVLALLAAISFSVDVPVSFVSSHSPHAYLIKAEV